VTETPAAGRLRRARRLRRPHPFVGLPREVPVLVGVAVAVALGFGVVAPAIPVFAREFGVGRTAAASVISVFAGMRFVSALGAGRLVDRFGARRVLATGIAVVAVSSLLAGLSQTYLQLLLLRGAGGVGSAMFTTSAYSLLLTSVPSSQRGRAVGLFSGGFLLGGIAGPAFGGLVAGISIRAPFFVYAVTLAAAGAIGLALLPRRRRDPGAPSDPGSRTTLLQALRNPSYRAALAAYLATNWTTLGVRSALVPLFVIEALLLPPLWVGVGFVVLAACDAAMLLPAGHFADRRGRKPLLVAGCALAAAGMVLLAVLPSLAGYLVAMAVVGLGSGMLHVAPGAVVGDVVDGRGGTPIAAYQMAGDAGQVLGPLVAGRLADGPGFGAAFGVTAGVLAAAGLLALSAPETRHADPAAGRSPASPRRS
jgi:MFS family permease